MELKKKFTELSTNENLYIITGIAILLGLGLGLQFQNTPEAIENGQIDVNLQLEKPGEINYRNVSVQNGSTVFTALSQTFEVEYEEYDFGYFVTSIDGLSQNETHYWMYQVNGVEADRAVNNYQLSNNDNITFRYTSEDYEE